MVNPTLMTFSNKGKTKLIKIIDEYRVIRNADKYKGLMEIEGIEIKVDKLKNIFLLTVRIFVY